MGHINNSVNPRVSDPNHGHSSISELVRNLEAVRVRDSSLKFFLTSKGRYVWVGVVARADHHGVEALQELLARANVLDENVPSPRCIVVRGWCDEEDFVLESNTRRYLEVISVSLEVSQHFFVRHEVGHVLRWWEVTE